MTCGECGKSVEACSCHVIDGGTFELGNHIRELGQSEQAKQSLPSSISALNPLHTRPKRSSITVK